MSGRRELAHAQIADPFFGAAAAATEQYQRTLIGLNELRSRPSADRQAARCSHAYSSSFGHYSASSRRAAAAANQKRARETSLLSSARRLLPPLVGRPTVRPSSKVGKRRATSRPPNQINGFSLARSCVCAVFALCSPSQTATFTTTN